MHEALYVVDQRVRGLDAVDLRLDLRQPFAIDDRRQLLERLTTIATLEQFAFGIGLRIADLDPHQKSVELRFRQRERPRLGTRILRRDDEKRLGQRPRPAIDGDLFLFHRFEQRALGLRRRAIHLVRENDLREYRALDESKRILLAVEYRHADDVPRQNIARELDPVERQAQHFR